MNFVTERERANVSVTVTPQTAAQEYGTYEAFRTRVLVDFAPVQEEAQAKRDLTTIKRKPEETVSDFNSRFRNLAAKSNLTDNAMLINLYQNALGLPTVTTQLLIQLPPLANLNDWYKQAAILDSTY